MAKLRITYNAPFTLTFALVCCAIFAITSTTGFLKGIVSVSGNFSFSRFLDYPGLLLHPLGHANWAHLLGNMSFILLLGPSLEHKYGSKDLLVMCGFTALCTGLVNVLLFDNGLWGASGIVFMFIILISFANVKSREIPLTFIAIVVVFIGAEIVRSFEDNNVSEFGHIMGGILGSVFGFIGSSRLKASQKVEDEPLI